MPAVDPGGACSEVEVDPSLFQALEGRVPEFYAIGDRTGLGRIAKAIRDAVRVACSI